MTGIDVQMRAVRAACERIARQEPPGIDPRAIDWQHVAPLILKEEPWMVDALLELGCPPEAIGQRDVTPSAGATTRGAALPPAVRRGAVARTTLMADVNAEDVRWLWHRRIPRGMLSELVGDPGAGKSTLTLRIAADITRGKGLPGDDAPCVPGNVLLLSAEDSAEHTIRPRLDACGADVSRVHLVRDIIAAAGETWPCLADPQHMAALADAVELIRPALVVIDPISAYLGGVDSHRDADVRAVLGPLARLAAEYDTAILLLRHLRKSAADRAIYRGGGSIAFVAAARVQMLAGHDPDDETRRALAVTKCNLASLAPAIGYRLVDGRVEWTGDTDLTASRMLAPGNDAETRTRQDEAVEYLRDTLAVGPRTTQDVEAGARRLGIKKRTLQRARATLGVESYRSGEVGRQGGGHWMLRLPGRSSPPRPDGGDNNGGLESGTNRLATQQEIEPPAGPDTLTPSCARTGRVNPAGAENDVANEADGSG